MSFVEDIGFHYFIELIESLFSQFLTEEGEVVVHPSDKHEKSLLMLCGVVAVILLVSILRKIF
ncbi:hypothetical protein AMD01_04735 [Priestia koreensis]|uniref:Uncharacterized protein n=1 Tax=Priestia koreensis TaxID=284581 RepID=A0A0M0LCG1_9BACI|nr:hypothetical protein AMD01_04735 [Priestia koreensis]